MNTTLQASGGPVVAASTVVRRDDDVKAVKLSSLSPPTSPAAVDIDGVPLRDGQKVDLKSVLGHMPEVDDDEECAAVAACGAAGNEPVQFIESQFLPVDDDDFEYGVDDDDENDDVAVSATPRKRRSSLKSVIHPTSEHHSLNASEQSSPHDDLSPDHAHKAVRFADALGLGLADVRDLVSTDEPPTIPPSALRDLHIRRRKRSRSQLTYRLDFEQPGSDPGFVTRVLADKVSLENCVACNDRADDRLSISGVIRVANVAFDKRLVVRYTVDSWHSEAHEVVASYLPGSNDGATDRFAFVIDPSPEVMTSSLSTPGSRLEFVVAYSAAGQTFWDNNAGHNYRVECVATAASPTSRDPSK